VGVASSHDYRGKMPLPQKKIQLHWLPNSADGGAAIENRFRGFRVFRS